MRSRVKKWGNSLPPRIPKLLADEVGLKEDALVDLSLRDGEVIASPVTGRKFTLKELLERVTEENIHSEVRTGQAVGKEVW